MLDALCTEIESRLSVEIPQASSVYLGGGTPSLLEPRQVSHLLETIRQNCQIDQDAEITIEVNPDDVSRSNLQVWKDVGINRLSVGIQSFHDQDLQMMNRSHDATQARYCIELIKTSSITNFSIDLIYGSSSTELEMWRENLNIVAEFEIPHLSCYALTVEPKTALHHQIAKGMVAAPTEASVYDQFMLLVDFATAAGYEHYEISNFAQPGFQAIHNSNYWSTEPYVGIGPAAHSFDGTKRCWNIADNRKYIRNLASSENIVECEELTTQQQYNEYIMTRLRTQRGIRYTELAEFGPTHKFEVEIAPFLRSGHMLRDQLGVKLSAKGMLIGDHIMSKLFR